MLVNQHIGILSKQEIIFSYLFRYYIFMGFSGGSAGKESTCSEGDLSSIPGMGRPLKKEMATHSPILAWRILWTV